VPKVYGVSGLTLVYVLLVFLNLGGIGQLLANFATLVVPAYYSLLAIESPGKADDTHYLTYWVVYAFFSVIEFWSGVILYWIPFYWVFKTIFFLYLSLPFYNGSRWIYVSVVRPIATSILSIRTDAAKRE
jgi:receptor expression-enhancing protein 5/6